MRSTVSVRPLGEGWSVSTELSANPMVFTRGPPAEATARRLARSLFEAGRAVEVEIWLRDGSCAGRWMLEPQAQDPEAVETTPASGPKSRAKRLISPG